MTYEESEKRCLQVEENSTAFSWGHKWQQTRLELFRALRDRLLFDGILERFEFLDQDTLNIHRRAADLEQQSVSVDFYKEPDFYFCKAGLLCCKTNDTDTVFYFIQRFVRP